MENKLSPWCYFVLRNRRSGEHCEGCLKSRNPLHVAWTLMVLRLKGFSEIEELHLQRRSFQRRSS